MRLGTFWYLLARFGVFLCVCVRFDTPLEVACFRAATNTWALRSCWVVGWAGRFVGLLGYWVVVAIRWALGSLDCRLGWSMRYVIGLLGGWALRSLRRHLSSQLIQKNLKGSPSYTEETEQVAKWLAVVPLPLFSFPTLQPNPHI